MGQSTVACPRISFVIAALLVGVAACSTSQTGSRPLGVDMGTPAAGQCPQPRETERAPDSYHARVNPLQTTAENLARGRLLYQKEAKPLACARCHGANGEGKGADARGLVPAPRNFTCAETMKDITDGQMYWVIENGSGDYHLPSRQGAQQIERPGRETRFTAMRPHKTYLTDTEIWQLIMYIRTLAPGAAEEWPGQE